MIIASPFQSLLNNPHFDPSNWRSPKRKNIDLIYNIYLNAFVYTFCYREYILYIIYLFMVYYCFFFTTLLVHHFWWHLYLKLLNFFPFKFIIHKDWLLKHKLCLLIAGKRISYKYRRCHKSWIILSTVEGLVDRLENILRQLVLSYLFYCWNLMIHKCFYWGNLSRIAFILILFNIHHCQRIHSTQILTLVILAKNHFSTGLMLGWD